MAFNINDFNSAINRNGLAKSNLFFVSITFPPGVVDESTMSSRDMAFFCQNVSLPSLEVSATPIKTRGYGPAEKRPTDMEFNPMSASFMVDANFRVMRTFHKWFQSVVHYDGTGGATTVNGKKLYEFGYKDDYAGSMNVIVYSQNTQQMTYQYSFRGLWPITVGEITPAWENTAEILTLPVTFSYSEMSVTGSVAGNLAAEIVESVSRTQYAGNGGQELTDQLRSVPVQRRVEERPANTEAEVAASRRVQEASTSAQIKGFTRSKVEDTPEYQKLLKEEIDKLGAYAYVDGKIGGRLKSNWRNTAYRKADMRYRGALAEGTLQPPEGSGIEVIRGG